MNHKLTTAKDEQIINQFERENNRFAYHNTRYTVGDFIELINEQQLMPPEPKLWSKERQSNFIESLILDYPIQVMVFYRDDNNQLTIVDGNEQLGAIWSFIHGQLMLTDLTIMTELNHLTYQDLPLRLQNDFKVRIINVILLNHTTPIIRQEVMKRLNRKNN